MTLRGRHNALSAIFSDSDQCQRKGRAVMEFLISARGAPGSIPIPRGSTCTPNSRHNWSRSTVTGVSFHLLYKSLNTVVPVALLPIRRMRGKSDSVSIVAPAATIARRASCRPLRFAVARRISTSATRQNIAPPQYVRPHVCVSSSPWSPLRGCPSAMPATILCHTLVADNWPSLDLAMGSRRSPALPRANDVRPQETRWRGGRVHVSWSNLIQDQLAIQLAPGASSKRLELHPHPPR